LSSLPDSDVQWVAGVYFFDENVDRRERFITEFLPPLTNPALGATAVLFGLADGDVSFTQDADSRSYAVFGQATYPLTEQFSFTGGLRYTFDDKKIQQVAISNADDDPFAGVPLFSVGCAAAGNPSLCAPYDVDGKDSWRALTGRAGLEYTTAKGDLIYVAVSRGYKSGVFPSQNNVLQSVDVALNPEKVWNYEVGLRSDWLDQRLRFNATGFYTDYTDLQQFILSAALALVTFNVDARILGAEIETIMVPFEGAQIGGSASFIDTKLKNVPDIGGSVTGLVDGNKLPQAPKTSFNIFASYEKPVARGLLSMRMNYSWRAKFFHEVTNLPETLIDAYGLLDARLAYEFDNGLEIAVWGKNLSDKEYQSHIIPFLGSGFALVGAPRTFGVTVGLEYN